MTEVNPKQVRAARVFLVKRRLTGVSPKLFALAAKESSRTLSEMLEFMGLLLGGGQNQSARRKQVVLNELGDG